MNQLCLMGHCLSGIGKPCLQMVPRNKNKKYCEKGKTLFWHHITNTDPMLTYGGMILYDMINIYREFLTMQKRYNNNIIIIEQNAWDYNHYPILLYIRKIKDSLTITSKNCSLHVFIFKNYGENYSKFDTRCIYTFDFIKFLKKTLFFV